MRIEGQRERERRGDLPESGAGDWDPHSGLVITCCGDPMVAVRDMNTPRPHTAHLDTADM